MSLAWDEGFEQPDRWQAEIDRTYREQREAGWDAPGGWARPGDPMCPKHRYGLVDGKCGLCVLSERGLREDSRDNGSYAVTPGPGPRSESAYGEAA